MQLTDCMLANRPVESNHAKTMNCGANETPRFTCCTHTVVPTPRYRRYRFSDLLVEELLQEPAAAFRGHRCVEVKSLPKVSPLLVCGATKACLFGKVEPGG